MAANGLRFVGMRAAALPGALCCTSVSDLAAADDEEEVAAAAAAR